MLISVSSAVVPKQVKNSLSSEVVVQAIHVHICAVTEAAAGSYREEILWASLGLCAAALDAGVLLSHTAGVSAAPA